MKRLAVAMIILMNAGTAFAGDCKTPSQTHSKEFEKLKKLEGKWEGTMQGDKPSEMNVTYHVTSGGSAVVETISPGTPHEMVSVYHDEKGALAMTHYCMMGNQPKLSSTGSKSNEINLTFAKDNIIDPKTEDHMNSLQIVFIDDDTLVERWGSVHGGKEADAKTVFKISRAK